jgi:hypothetical protein
MQVTRMLRCAPLSPIHGSLAPVCLLFSNAPCPLAVFTSDVTNVADWHRFDADTDPDPTFRVMNREQS